MVEVEHVEEGLELELELEVKGAMEVKLKIGKALDLKKLS